MTKSLVLAEGVYFEKKNLDSQEDVGKTFKIKLMNYKDSFSQNCFPIKLKVKWNFPPEV